MATIFVDWSHMAVIEVVPFFVMRVLAKSSVMTEADAAKVVRDGITIVDEGLVFLVRAEHKWTHVQSFKREINQGIQLLATSGTIPVL